MKSFFDLPYDDRPLTPQVKGRRAEKPMAKREGLNLHPNSGAGHIKFDSSDENRVVEMKTVGKSFAMNSKYLSSIYTNAVRQEKDAYLLVDFGDGITAECLITKRHL